MANPRYRQQQFGTQMKDAFEEAAKEKTDKGAWLWGLMHMPKNQKREFQKPTTIKV
jgi:hypothetical protein